MLPRILPQVHLRKGYEAIGRCEAEGVKATAPPHEFVFRSIRHSTFLSNFNSRCVSLLDFAAQYTWAPGCSLVDHRASTILAMACEHVLR